MATINPYAVKNLQQTLADIREVSARLDRATAAAGSGGVDPELLRRDLLVIGNKARETGKAIKAVAGLVTLKANT